MVYPLHNKIFVDGCFWQWSMHVQREKISRKSLVSNIFRSQINILFPLLWERELQSLTLRKVWMIFLGNSHQVSSYCKCCVLLNIHLMVCNNTHITEMPEGNPERRSAPFCHSNMIKFILALGVSRSWCSHCWHHKDNHRTGWREYWLLPDQEVYMNYPKCWTHSNALMQSCEWHRILCCHLDNLATRFALYSLPTGTISCTNNESFGLLELHASIVDHTNLYKRWCLMLVWCKT